MMQTQHREIANSLKGEKTSKEAIVLAAVAAGITVNQDNIQQLDDFARIIELYVIDRLGEHNMKVAA